MIQERAGAAMRDEALAWLLTQPPKRWLPERELRRRGLLREGELERLVDAGLRVRRRTRKARLEQAVRAGPLVDVLLGSLIDSVGVPRDELVAQLEQLPDDELAALRRQAERLL